jgi:hypothetical protein
MTKSTKAIILLAVGFASIAGAYLYKEYTEVKLNIELAEKLRKSPPGEIKIKSLNMKDGDIIFHKSLSSQSEAIQIATHSEYTHCGIVYKQLICLRSN